MITKLMDPLTAKVMWFGCLMLLPLEDSTRNSTCHGLDLNYTVVKQLSDSTYRIQHTLNRSKRIVVHFDRLKSFTGVVQSPTHPQHQPSNAQHQLSSSTSSTSPRSKEPALHLIDGGDSDNEDDDQQTHSMNSRRYPSRSHRPPGCLTDYIHH